MSDVRLADNEDSPAELVRLLLPEPQRHSRLSVAAGDVLAGRYLVVEEISRSGMGLVYKALDRRREKVGSAFPWVALKFAQPAGDCAPDTSVHLRQEFLKLSRLNHPNIVSVFDYDSDHGLDFVVMEWLEGETLAEVLSGLTSKRLALAKSEEVIRCVAGGLAHAHALGIVHGDVKPSNIVLTNARTIKLIDFGSSGAAGSSGEGQWATRAYASCGVLQGQAPAACDDVFALGVTAYYLLSGERPFGELSALEARQQGIVPVPLPQDARARWSAVERALRFKDSQRPPNAGGFLEEFNEPPPEVDERAADASAAQIAYGAIAVGLLIALVAWAVGTISDVPSGVGDMLENGQNALAEGRLVEPEAENAFEYFSSVLTVAPDNADAREGLRQITETYLTRARRALQNDDRRAAAAHLDTARMIMPQHFGIALTEDLISRHGRDLVQKARIRASDDLEEAESLLDRASRILPTDDAELTRVRQELQQERQARELETLMAHVDERILSERLTVPSGDSAVDVLGAARALAPEDRQVALAADRVVTALLFQSMFAISNGNLGDAARYLEAAKGLGVRHIAMARAEYELAKARHEAVASGRRDAAAN